MNLTECYRILELAPGANVEQIKASYRRLARQYHPDVNPNRDAQAKFIQIAQAYKLLLGVVTAPRFQGHRQAQSPTPPTQKRVQVNFDQRSPCPPPPPKPKLSAFDQQLKWKSYHLLQQLLKMRRYARATTLAESLAQRFPQDLEVRQWQAITYQQWGRQLLYEGQLEKAKIYLQKALRTDPHNRSLWAEVERDWREIERCQRTLYYRSGKS